MYVRYRCDADPAHEFFGREGESVARPTPCPIPGCKGPVKVARSGYKHPPRRSPLPGQKERIALLPLNSSLHARPRHAEGTARRAKLAEQAQKLGRAQSVELARKATKAEIDAAIGPDTEPDVVDIGDDDSLYAPGEPFKPSMRYTPSSGQRFAAGQRDLKTVVVLMAHSKVMAAPVKAAGPAHQQPNSVMGTSAHLFSGRGVEKSGNVWCGNFEEWNHLVADCLGGPTDAPNLVAASASCNTFMLQIEACLRGKTQFSVEVTAFCARQHVAEWIQYKVISRTGKVLSYDIDATSPYFTREDGADIRKDVLRFTRRYA